MNILHASPLKKMSREYYRSREFPLSSILVVEFNFLTYMYKSCNATFLNPFYFEPPGLQL